MYIRLTLENKIVLASLTTSAPGAGNGPANNGR